MSLAKVAISIESATLKKLDYYVKKRVFKNRSQAIQAAVNQSIDVLEHQRLANECAKLDITSEQQMADYGLDEDEKEWPTF